MKIKMVIDALMMFIMLIEMSNRFTGNVIHEVAGISMFILFLIHNILNRQWYQNIIRGKINIHRFLTIVINLSLLLLMITLMISSVPISQTVFAVFEIHSGMQIRQIHTLAAYWGLIIMSIHLGMHWEMIINVFKRKSNINKIGKGYTFIIRMFVVIISIYGVYASFIRNIGSKLVLYYTFDIWLTGEALIKISGDYFTIIWLYVSITYYLLKLIKIIKNIK